MDIIPDELFKTLREWQKFRHELREEYYGEMMDDDYRRIREYGDIALPDSSLVLEFTPENYDPHKLSWISEESGITDCDKWGFAVNADHLSQLLIPGAKYY